MNDLIGIKAKLTRDQVGALASIPDRVLADLWAGLLTDYPASKTFFVMAAGDS